MKNIPKELIVLLLKEEIDSTVFFNTRMIYNTSTSLDGKPLWFIDPISKRCNSKKYKLRCLKYKIHSRIRRYDNSSGADNQEYLDERVIENSGFSLAINTNYRTYSNVVVELYHKDFDNLSYRPCLLIDIYTFTELFEKSPNISSGRIQDQTFKLEVIKTGTYPQYKFISEDLVFENSYTKVSIDVCNKLFTSRKTRTWIPGNIYCYENRDTFLCLGTEYSFEAVDTTYKWAVKSSPRSFLTTPDNNCKVLKHFNACYIVLPITDNNITSVLKFIGKTVGIGEFIKTFKDNDLSVVSPDCYSAISYIPVKDVRPAVNLGYSAITFKNIVNDSIVESIKNTVSEIIVSDFDLFFKKIKSYTSAFDLMYVTKETTLSNKESEVFKKFLKILKGKFEFVIKNTISKLELRSIPTTSENIVDSILYGKVGNNLIEYEFYEKKLIAHIRSLTEGDEGFKLTREDLIFALED